MTVWSLFAPWQALAMVCVLLGVFVLAPWLTGAIYRRRSMVPPRLSQRVGVSLAAAIVGGLAGVLLPFWVAINIRWNPPGWLCAAAVVAGFVLVVSLVSWLFLACLAGSAKLRLALLWPTGVILLSVSLCCLCGLYSLGRARIAKTEVVDTSNLWALGKGLGMYCGEYGAYPDDLRRLVDAHLASTKHLVAFGRSHTLPGDVVTPYAGPCDVRYIPLPPDAPPELVLVWLDPTLTMHGRGLYLDGRHSFHSVSADELANQVALTKRWLLAHQPA